MARAREGDVSLEDTLPVMLWSARPDMSCARVNRAWLDFTGLPASQAVGEGWARVVHPEDLPRWLDACVRAFDAREPFEIEYRLRRAEDGSYRWFLARGVPVHDAEGRITRWVGSSTDIEDRRRSEDTQRFLADAGAAVRTASSRAPVATSDVVSRRSVGAAFMAASTSPSTAVPHGSRTTC